MIWVCCHESIFLFRFTSSTFLLMLHFRHSLLGGCFCYVFHSGVEVGDNRQFSCLCFFLKGTTSEISVLLFQYQGEHTCLLYAFTILPKCVCLPWPEKRITKQSLIQHSGGSLCITVTLPSSIGVRCTLWARFFKNLNHIFLFAYFSP